MAFYVIQLNKHSTPFEAQTSKHKADLKQLDMMFAMQLYCIFIGNKVGSTIVRTQYLLSSAAQWTFITGGTYTAVIYLQVPEVVDFCLVLHNGVNFSEMFMFILA